MRTGRGLSLPTLFWIEVHSIEAWPLPSDFPTLRAYTEHLSTMGPRHRATKADLLRHARSLRRYLALRSVILHGGPASTVLAKALLLSQLRTFDESLVTHQYHRVPGPCCTVKG